MSQTRVPDDVYEEVRNQVSEEELVKLTVAVAMIKAWCRIAISFRAVHPITQGRRGLKIAGDPRLGHLPADFACRRR